MWFFQYLGLDVDCTIRDVKIAFRKLVLRSHPDKFQNEVDKQRATVEFRKLYNAYKDALNFLEKSSHSPHTDTSKHKEKATQEETATQKETTNTNDEKEEDISDIIKLFNQVCRELDHETMIKFQEKIDKIPVILDATMPDFEKGFEILYDNFVHFQYKVILENMNYSNKSGFETFIVNKLIENEMGAKLYLEQRIAKLIKELYQIYDEHDKSKLMKWMENTLSSSYDYQQIIQTISKSINKPSEIDPLSVSREEIIKQNLILQNENKKMTIIILLSTGLEKWQKKSETQYWEQLRTDADKIAQVFPNAIKIKEILSSWYLTKRDRDQIKKCFQKKYKMFWKI